MLMGRAKPKIDLTKEEKRGYLTEVVLLWDVRSAGRERICLL